MAELDASIPLQVRPPQGIDMLQMLSHVAQLKQAQAQLKLIPLEMQQRQAQIQDTQAQIQQRQRDLEANQKLQGLFADPANHDAFAKGDYSAITEQVSPNIAMPAIEKLNEMQNKAQSLRGEQAKFYAEGRGRLQDLIQSIDPSQPQAPQQFAQGVQALGQEHPELVKQLQPPQQGQDFGQYLNGLATVNGLGHKILENAAALKEKGSTAAKNQAEADKVQAELPGIPDKNREAAANATLAEAKANLTKLPPEAWTQQVDAIVPPTDPLNMRTKARVAFYAQKGNPEEAQKVLDSAANEINMRERETNPALIKSRVSEAVQKAQAVAPIEINKAVQQQIAIAKNSPGGFNEIVDPKARASAEAAYEKDSKEYADKVGAAKQLQDFISAAQSGNKAAPGLIPMAEVRQLVNRVNRQELEGVSKSAGSVWDRVQGYVNTATEGQPIPPAVLNDMKKISDTMQEAAKRTYGFKVQVNNKTYGGKIEPIELTSAPSAQGAQTSSAPQFKAGDTVMYNGKPHKIQSIKSDGKLVLEN